MFDWINYFIILYNTTGWILSKLIYWVTKTTGSGKPEAAAKCVNKLSWFEVQTMTGVKLSQKSIHNTIIITANMGGRKQLLRGSDGAVHRRRRLKDIKLVKCSPVIFDYLFTNGQPLPLNTSWNGHQQALKSVYWRGFQKLNCWLSAFRRYKGCRCRLRIQEGQKEGHRQEKEKLLCTIKKMCCSDKIEDIKTSKKSKGVWGKSEGQSLKLFLRFERELCSNERKDVSCIKWNMS